MVRVAVFNAHRRRRVRKDPVARAVRTVLKGEGIRDATVSIVFIDHLACRRLNRRYLSRNRVTDVISFPLEGGTRLEGEVYVNLDQARLQADAYGVSMANETARLVVHGTLHLAGYDDVRRAEAVRMRKRQEIYVSSLE